jgi:hypothetical protein
VLRQCLALAVRQTASLAAFYVPEQAQGPRRMKVTLTLVNKGRPLYEGVHDITDASSFGNAFARAWLEVQDQKLMQTTSVGQLMEEINDGVLDDLNGAEITFIKAQPTKKSG